MTIFTYNYKYQESDMILMAKMIFELDDKKEQEFRDMVIKVKGFHKGVIKESLEEAIDEWIVSRQEGNVKRHG
jgi:hypothetical protein